MFSIESGNQRNEIRFYVTHSSYTALFPTSPHRVPVDPTRSLHSSLMCELCAYVLDLRSRRKREHMRALRKVSRYRWKDVTKRGFITGIKELALTDKDNEGLWNLSFVLVFLDDFVKLILTFPPRNGGGWRINCRRNTVSIGQRRIPPTSFRHARMAVPS